MWPVTSPVLLPVSQIIAAALTSLPSPAATRPQLARNQKKHHGGGVLEAFPNGILRVPEAVSSDEPRPESSLQATSFTTPSCINGRSTLLGLMLEIYAWSFRMCLRWPCHYQQQLAASSRDSRKPAGIKAGRASQSLYSFFCACSPLAPQSLNDPVTSPDTTHWLFGDIAAQVVFLT